MTAELHELIQAFSAKIFEASIQVIDTKFGPGYAMKNPGLLASVIQSTTKLYAAIKE